MFSDAVACDFKPGRAASQRRRRAARSRERPRLGTPPAAVTLSAKYVFKDSKGNDAVGVELFNGTPGDAGSLVGKLSIDLRKFRSPNASTDEWMRAPAPAHGRRAASPDPWPTPPQPDCRDQRTRQARHHVQRLRGAVPASRRLPKPPPPGALPA